MRAIYIPAGVSPALSGLWMSSTVPTLLSHEQNVQCTCETCLKSNLIGWVSFLILQSFWKRKYNLLFTELYYQTGLLLSQKLTTQTDDSCKQVIKKDHEIIKNYTGESKRKKKKNSLCKMTLSSTLHSSHYECAILAGFSSLRTLTLQNINICVVFLQ